MDNILINVELGKYFRKIYGGVTEYEQRSGCDEEYQQALDYINREEPDPSDFYDDEEDGGDDVSDCAGFAGSHS